MHSVQQSHPCIPFVVARSASVCVWVWVWSTWIRPQTCNEQQVHRQRDTQCSTLPLTPPTHCQPPLPMRASCWSPLAQASPLRLAVSVMRKPRGAS